MVFKKACVAGMSRNTLEHIGQVKTDATSEADVAYHSGEHACVHYWCLKGVK